MTETHTISDVVLTFTPTLIGSILTDWKVPQQYTVAIGAVLSAYVNREIHTLPDYQLLLMFGSVMFGTWIPWTSVATTLQSWLGRSSSNNRHYPFTLVIRDEELLIPLALYASEQGWVNVHQSRYHLAIEERSQLPPPPWNITAGSWVRKYAAAVKQKVFSDWKRSITFTSIQVSFHNLQDWCEWVRTHRWSYQDFSLILSGRMFYTSDEGIEVLFQLEQWGVPSNTEAFSIPFTTNLGLVQKLYYEHQQPHFTRETTLPMELLHRLSTHYNRDWVEQCMQYQSMLVKRQRAKLPQPGIYPITDHLWVVVSTETSEDVEFGSIKPPPPQEETTTTKKEDQENIKVKAELMETADKCTWVRVRLLSDLPTTEFQPLPTPPVPLVSREEFPQHVVMSRTTRYMGFGEINSSTEEFYRPVWQICGKEFTDLHCMDCRHSRLEEWFEEFCEPSGELRVGVHDLTLLSGKVWVSELYSSLQNNTFDAYPIINNRSQFVVVFVKEWKAFSESVDSRPRKAPLVKSIHPKPLCTYILHRVDRPDKLKKRHQKKRKRVAQEDDSEEEEEVEELSKEVKYVFQRTILRNKEVFVNGDLGRIISPHAERFRALKERFDSPELYKKYMLRWQDCGIFYGPSGCSKTMHVFAIADYFDRHVLMINCSRFKSPSELIPLLLDHRFNVYESGAYLETHLRSDECILLFDEIDRMFPEESSPLRTTMLSELLSMIDGVINLPKRMMYATTNHLDALPVELVRSMRLTPFAFTLLTPNDARAHLRQLFPNEGVLIENTPFEQWIHEARKAPSMATLSDWMFRSNYILSEILSCWEQMTPLTIPQYQYGFHPEHSLAYYERLFVGRGDHHEPTAGCV